MKTQGMHLERWITLFSILFIFSSTSPRAEAHPIIQYWENRSGEGAGLILDPRVSFFSTSDGNSSTLTDFDLIASYGFSDQWFLIGRLSALSENIHCIQIRAQNKTAMPISEMLLLILRSVHLLAFHYGIH